MNQIDQISISHQFRREIPLGLRYDDAFMSLASAVSIMKTPAGQTAALFLQGSLRLGVAENGLPIMLDLYDPVPGPLLVAGDEGGGKTTFLQSLTLGSDLQDPGEILFGVLTPFPKEWVGLEALSNCLGIWPAYHSSARHFLAQLVSWGNVLQGSRELVILMVDGLDLLIANGFHDLNDMRWLLTYGPRRHVWPIVSINPGRLPRPETWLGYFQTRIFGRVKHPQTANILGASSEIDLSQLSHKGVYGLWRQGSWIKFQLPSIS